MEHPINVMDWTSQKSEQMYFFDTVQVIVFSYSFHIYIWAFMYNKYLKVIVLLRKSLMAAGLFKMCLQPYAQQEVDHRKVKS